jgi:hypothetical protein
MVIMTRVSDENTPIADEKSLTSRASNTRYSKLLIFAGLLVSCLGVMLVLIHITKAGILTAIFGLFLVLMANCSSWTKKVSTDA